MTERDYIAEMIHTVEMMSRQLVEFRQEITRATMPLYPRITEMERRREDDAKERIARQIELDRKLEHQDAIASQQGAAIQQITSAVKAQGETMQQHAVLLKQISTRQVWGRILESLLILGGLALIAWWLRGMT